MSPKKKTTTDDSADLMAHLHQRIASDGALTIAQYMQEALGNPRFGYYTGRDPLGVAGDFITAPEVSQMFGELLGLWCVVSWQAMGQPDPVHLVELGPGRGTMMADAVRAARAAAPFAAAVRPHLVEASPALRDRQRTTLTDAGLPVGDAAGAPTWHSRFAEVPDGPLLLLANEFFDVLPIRQFLRMEAGWCERMVDVAPGNRLCHSLSMPVSMVPGIPEDLLDVPVGSMVEVGTAATDLAYAVGDRVERFGGAALIIDYGHARSGAGETLQAVRGHSYHDPLETPGEADLTAHVDFKALAEAAAEAGAAVHGPVSQGAFLGRLGIAARAESLLQGATPDQAQDIAAALRRLTDAEEMGELFKVLAIARHDLPAPPGFA